MTYWRQFRGVEIWETLKTLKTMTTPSKIITRVLKIINCLLYPGKAINFIVYILFEQSDFTWRFEKQEVRSNVTLPDMNTWNVHRMFITHTYITYRNPETRKTPTTSQFRYETFYYLCVKRFFNIRREIQSFYADFSICPKPRATPAVRPRRARKATRLLWTLELNWLFSNISPRFWCVTSLPSLVTSPLWDFYRDISEWHFRSAPAWTPAFMFAPN